MNPYEISVIANRALNRARAVHDALGENGLQQVQKNQHGETALRADIECEKAVIDYLEFMKMRVRVRSEEHGVVNIGEPEYTAILDGIDGTSLYKEARGVGKYGTMLGIFAGTDPTYADYLTCSIAQHATKRHLMGNKGFGAHTILPGPPRALQTSFYEKFDSSLNIYVDDAAYEMNRKTFTEPLRRKGFKTTCTKCSCMYYADVAEGLAHFALECTRKGNLELAVAYGLIKEAGGVMVDLDGNDIGPRKYLEFGQKENEHIPIITAANRTLAMAMVDFLKGA